MSSSCFKAYVRHMFPFYLSCGRKNYCRLGEFCVLYDTFDYMTYGIIGKQNITTNCIKEY
jgi:hypothetical protein